MKIYLRTGMGSGVMVYWAGVFFLDRLDLFSSKSNGYETMCFIYGYLQLLFPVVLAEVRSI